MFESQSQALVNTVNTMGVMGKGIALQFKRYYPDNFYAYKKACDNNSLTIGKLFVYDEENLLFGRKTIINFPTKEHWGNPSEYSYIRAGLGELAKLIKDRNIESISIPPLGAGNGGLQWNKIKELIEEYLSDLDCDISVYQPTRRFAETEEQQSDLNPARAMMLGVLLDMVSEGEFISEFATEKIVYFLQRFGAQDQFNIAYTTDYYGPHSGKIKQVLKFMNDKYVGGFNPLLNDPFKELNINMSAKKEVESYLNLTENLKYKEISQKTKEFLSGFYSSFGLELLSRIDYIRQTEKIYTDAEIVEYLTNYTSDKFTKIDDLNHISLINDHLNTYLPC